MAAAGRLFFDSLPAAVSAHAEPCRSSGDGKGQGCPPVRSPRDPAHLRTRPAGRPVAAPPARCPSRLATAYAV